MPQVSSRALFGVRFVRHLSRLTRVYWTSPDATKGSLLLALTVALELGTVYGAVRLSVAQRRIFDAFESKQIGDFSQAVDVFFAFAGILWSLSGHWAFAFKGFSINIPGVMMWVAVLYAVVTSWLTHRVGRQLVPIQFDRERFEADFRFALVRFPENVEVVALSRGEDGDDAGPSSRTARP